MDATASWAWLTDIFELVDSGRRQERSIFFVSSLFQLGLAATANGLMRLFRALIGVSTA